MESNIRILLVDDEEDMRHLIQMYLENAGFICDQAQDAKQCYEKLNQHDYQLLLLDIMLPDEDGFSLCEKIRSFCATPIIFLSAKGEEWDKVKGLQLGADDYMVKPFSPGELVARIQAVLRRSGSVGLAEKDLIKIGEITIDKKARKVLVLDQLVTLTLKEYEMLLFFIANNSQALSRDQLLEKVWGMDYHGSLRTVDTHVKTLRMKLGKADYIATVWGIGYKFEVTSNEASTEYSR